ncbi:MAG: MaoC family dehydratase [Syntrophomonadaceae bacterium]|jgi:3-hydroxybutyryl-CoA dehydratase
MKNKLPLKVGDAYVFLKTVSEADVLTFAEITGDFSRMHTDEEFMKQTRYKTRIAHGILSIAIASTAATQIQVQANAEMPSVAYGFDRVRFIKPVYIGDTLTTKYIITEADEATLSTIAKVEVTNQRGEVVTAAQHILKFFPLEA